MTSLTQVPFWKTDRFWLAIYMLITLFVSVKEMFFEPQSIGAFKTGNGNFTIFYQSFQHLWEGKTLYGFYPEEYENRYNYSPTFAFLMLPFGLLPYTFGGLLWNLGNGLLFFKGLRQLHIAQDKRFFLYWFIIFEAYTSLINFQTNPSITALVIWVVVFLERGQFFWAACLLMLGTWTKIIALLAGVFWFLYPKKGLFIVYCIFWSAVFFALPLCFMSFSKLLFQYQEWFSWLTKHTEFHGGSGGLMNAHALFRQILGIHIGISIFIGIGGLALLGSIWYQRKNLHELTFKMLVLANVLIFLVIFNPGSESPTFVIAMTGIGIWYIYSPASPWYVGLAVFAFVLTGLSQTDLFPAYLRNHFTRPYALKALPCLVIWVVSVVGLYMYKSQKPSK